MTEIKAGQFYRRKSDGGKLLAICEVSDGVWRFWDYTYSDTTQSHPAKAQEWTEPKRKVKLWPAFTRDYPGYRLTDVLFADNMTAMQFCGANSFIRLATEYPPIEVDEE